MLRSLGIKIGLGIFFAVLLRLYVQIYAIFFGSIVFVSFGTVFFTFVLGSFFMAPFIFPYLKSVKGDWVLKGILFGLLMWVINFSEAWSFLWNIVIKFNGVISVFPLFFGPPFIFMLMGVITSFIFKKLLLVEYEKNYSRIKVAVPIIVLLVCINFFVYKIVSKLIFNVYYQPEATISTDTTMGDIEFDLSK